MTDLDSNEFVNEVTLNLLISKSQLQKLNKLRKNENLLRDNINYDIDKITYLFNQLLNNNQPDDLLEDVKSSFDNFIEKSVYYLEIHDKNVNIQKEREYIKNESELDKLETNEFDVDESGIDENNDFVYENENEEYFEEPKESTIKVNKKYSTKLFVKNGVDDIQKLPLDWFNTTRQSYKVNQIIPRKKETVINSSPSTTIFFDQKIKI
jgi:hypothetical protein